MSLRFYPRASSGSSVGTTWRRHNPPEDQEDAVERVEGRVEAGALSKGPDANHALLLAELVT